MHIDDQVMTKLENKRKKMILWVMIKNPKDISFTTSMKEIW
jgi:hypothetical protein